MAAVTSTQHQSGDLMSRALREALYAGVIAFGLFVLLVGLKTDQNIRNELILVQRWGLLAIVVLLVAVGRFLMVAYVRPELDRRKAAKGSVAAVETAPGFVRRNINGIGILLLFIYPVLMVLMFGFHGSLK